MERNNVRYNKERKYVGLLIHFYLEKPRYDFFGEFHFEEEGRIRGVGGEGGAEVSHQRKKKMEDHESQI